MGAYSPVTAAILLQLAQAAQQDLSQISSLVLPPGWSPTWAYTGKSVAGAPAGQGFYATGTIAGAAVSVLALAVPWTAQFNNLYSPGLNPDGKLPNAVVPFTANTYMEVSIVSMYGSGLRSWIWKNLPQGQTLYVTGMGVGGVVAQIAAVDLIPSNTGPDKQPGPTSAPVSYVFSTPLAGDRGFAAYFQKNAASSYTVTVGTNTLTIDYFPTIPNSAYGDSTLSNGFYTLLGNAQQVSALLPSIDDPWVERGGNFYLSALGGTPTPPPTQPASIPFAPTGFSQPLAFVFAQLCATAYSQFQHQKLPMNLPQPYGWNSNLTSVYSLQPAVNNPRVPPSPAVICSIFTSPTTVVVAFRGMVTWAEIVAVQGNTYQTIADFLPVVNNNRQSSISQGAYNVYTGAAGAVTFRQQLVQTLLSIAGGKDLYLTGHDFGGVLATIACYDLVAQRKQNPSIPLPAGLYTFGSQAAGDNVFAVAFNAAYSPSYQIMRSGDFIARVNPSFSYQAVQSAVSLRGVPPNDDPTAHSITSYIQLLNPSGFSAVHVKLSDTHLEHLDLEHLDIELLERRPDESHEPKEHNEVNPRKA